MGQLLLLLILAAILASCQTTDVHNLKAVPAKMELLRKYAS